MINGSDNVSREWKGSSDDCGGRKRVDMWGWSPRGRKVLDGRWIKRIVMVDHVHRHLLMMWLIWCWGGVIVKTKMWWQCCEWRNVIVGKASWNWTEIATETNLYSIVVSLFRFQYTGKVLYTRREKDVKGKLTVVKKVILSRDWKSGRGVMMVVK